MADSDSVIGAVFGQGARHTKVPETEADFHLARLAVRFLAHKGGTTAIEYTLVASLIALVIFASLGQVGDAVLALYQKIHF